jgi:hypothetical protein
MSSLHATATSYSIRPFWVRAWRRCANQERRPARPDLLEGGKGLVPLRVALSPLHTGRFRRTAPTQPNRQASLAQRTPARSSAGGRPQCIHTAHSTSAAHAHTRQRCRRTRSSQSEPTAHHLALRLAKRPAGPVGGAAWSCGGPICVFAADLERPRRGVHAHRALVFIASASKLPQSEDQQLVQERLLSPAVLECQRRASKVQYNVVRFSSFVLLTPIHLRFLPETVPAICCLCVLCSPIFDCCCRRGMVRTADGFRVDGTPVRFCSFRRDNGAECCVLPLAIAQT